MNINKNIKIHGARGKALLVDLFFLHTSEKKPVVIYSHGFNGFKDWGNFDLIAKQFASAGFVFVKFNFSHNGTTVEQPEEFADLNAYSENNYTTELEDLKLVIDWLVNGNEYEAQMDTSRLGLLGHSLGGGISILKAHEDERVKALVTWASVAECNTPWGSWSSEKIKAWIDTGVQYVTNSRTRQELPLKYQLFEDYQHHAAQLNIEQAVKNLKVPFLICHGTKDTSVSVEKAHLLREWSDDAELFLVESDHVFGRKHPWTEVLLPGAMQAVTEKTIDFFTANL
ncbi:MAG TPA: dienelactone hydrolase family protein [Flavipsychrobacter sp.]|nr:dienelactone hydrolase family protein [Flavipsychrobacter sp.]